MSYHSQTGMYKPAHDSFITIKKHIMQMKNIFQLLLGSHKSFENLVGNEHAIGTMLRSNKGPVIPPPILNSSLQIVVDAIVEWPDIIATTHWDPFYPTRVDGVDLYFGEQELGHIHLDGRVHIATSPSLGKVLVSQGLAKPLIYLRGWVEEKVQDIGAEAAVELFRSNYDRLAGVKLSM